MSMGERDRGADSDRACGEVLVISPLAEKLGGGELQTLALARRVRRIGVPVVLTGVSRVRERRGRFLVRLRVPRFPGAGLIVAWRILLRVMRRPRPALLQVNGPILPGMLILPLARLIGIPTLVVPWGSCRQGEPPFDAGPADRLRRILVRYASAVVALTRDQAQALGALGLDAGRIHVIPNGVDVQRFRPPAPGERQPLSVLFVGRLHPVKGLEALIEAWRHVAARFPDARLELRGEGPLQSLLESRVAALDLEPTVRLLGPSRAVAPDLRRAAVFVLPSLSEGLPNAVLEAMASGCAIVASRLGGTEEILEDGRTALLVPPGDATALADAMLRLLGDRDRREALGSTARAVAVERYALERIAERYSALYGQLSGLSGG